jgi:hypothetical protein
MKNYSKKHQVPLEACVVIPSFFAGLQKIYEYIVDAHEKCVLEDTNTERLTNLCPQHGSSSGSFIAH